MLDGTITKQLKNC